MTFDWQWSLARQKTISDIFKNSISDDFNANLLYHNNSADKIIAIDDKTKSNLNKNKTSKNNDNFCKTNPITSIEKFFQQVQDWTIYKKLTKNILE